MNYSIEAAKQIKDFLVNIRKNDSLDSNALHALNRDTSYIEECIAILSNDDAAAINDLWQEVQYLSRFFGGDYAQGAQQSTLMRLADEFQSALLNDVETIRAKG